MELHDLPAMPAPLTPAQPVVVPVAPAETPAPQASGGLGLKRIVVTGALSALLLVGGAAAVVSAASPEPSSSAPSTSWSRRPPARPIHSTRPHRGSGGSTADCPNMGVDPTRPAPEAAARVARLPSRPRPPRPVTPGGPSFDGSPGDVPPHAIDHPASARRDRRRLLECVGLDHDARRHRCRAAGSGRPLGDRVRDRARDVAAIAFDVDGRLWVATAAFEDAGDDAVYLVRGAGAAPVQGDRRRAARRSACLAPRRALRRVGRTASTPTAASTALDVRTHVGGPDAPGGRRRGQRHGLSPGRSTRHRHLGALRRTARRARSSRRRRVVPARR